MGETQTKSFGGRLMALVRRVAGIKTSEAEVPSIICNCCRQPILNSDEQVDRIYRVKATGNVLPKQKKHDACDRAYHARRLGLEKLRR